MAGWPAAQGPYRVASFVYAGRPLQFAVEQLALHCGLQIIWAPEVTAKGIHLIVVTRNFYNVPVHYALAELVRPYNLEVVWNGHALVISPIVVVPPPPPPPPVDPLDKVGDFNFADMTLKDAAAHLSVFSGLVIEWEPYAANWLPHPAKLTLPQTTVRVALTQVLGQYNLVWKEVAGRIIISAPPRLAPPPLPPVVVPRPRPVPAPVRPVPGPPRPLR